MSRLIIFTDLDGTLLDANTYSFEPAREALVEIKKKNIPLVIVSSKTAQEIIYYRKLLNCYHPFISENGGGIFIPRGYFREMPFWLNISEKFGFDLIVQGTPYRELVNALDRLKSMNFKIRGFSDLSVQEICEITKLTEEEARLSKERNFDEPVIVDESVDISELKQGIKDMGLKYTSGKYLHLIGNNDKGGAVKELRNMFKRNIGDIVTVAIGDNANDIPMFLNVDYPVVVKKPDAKHDEDILKEVPNIILSDGIGPEGFNKSIINIIDMFEEINDKA